MAAAHAAEGGLDCVMLEPNKKLGRKLRITGKGRCNLTNNCDINTLMGNIPVNARFLYGALNRFGPGETMEFFENIGVPLKTERGGRVFPVSDNANDVADALDALCRRRKVRIIPARALEILTNDGAVTGVTFQGGKLDCPRVLLATGGLSYPASGSGGDGFIMARKLGHTVTELRPSLVPLIVPGGCEDLTGLSLRNVRLTAFEKGKKVFEDFGEMLFTHFGVSGPLVLSASAHMRKVGSCPCRIELDLKPALDNQTLDRRLLSDFEKNKNKDFINALDDLLPKKLIPVVVKAAGIDPRQKVNSITREQRSFLGSVLKAFPLEISGTRPIDEAIITSGGISLREVDPKTMESKLIRGLYFAGEILDLDAYTGGFNLQIAWSTAMAAASAVRAAERKG